MGAAIIPAGRRQREGQRLALSDPAPTRDWAMPRLPPDGDDRAGGGAGADKGGGDSGGDDKGSGNVRDDDGGESTGGAGAPPLPPTPMGWLPLPPPELTPVVAATPVSRTAAETVPDTAAPPEAAPDPPRPDEPPEGVTRARADCPPELEFTPDALTGPWPPPGSAWPPAGGAEAEPGTRPGSGS